MHIKDLINTARIEAWDNSNPPLFSDNELAMWANEAQMEACLRKKLLRENYNPVLVQFDIIAGVRSYPLDTRMFEITHAQLVPKGQVGGIPWILGITTDEEMDTISNFWRSQPFRPMAIIHRDNALDTDCIPNASYTINVEGYRLPIATLGLETVIERKAAGSVTFSGAAGSVQYVFVNGLDILGGAVAYTTSLPITVTAIATQINSNQNRYVASANGAVLTITDLPTTGSMHNQYPVAVAATTLTAVCTPLRGGIDAVTTALEINGIHHRHLVKWMLHRAYQKPDSETMNPDKSKLALAEFEQYFGPRPDADNRKRQNASRPHRNRAYA